MRSRFVRRYARSTFAFALSLAACGSGEKLPIEERFDELGTVDEQSGAFSKQMKVLAAIAYGTETRPVAYANPPRFRAYSFTGAAGDQVDVWVRSPDGDAVAWLLDSHGTIIAMNDDAAPGTTDSHIVATLPQGGSTKRYLAFREHDLAPATFQVALKGGKPAPAPADFYSCRFDADCVAVPKVGCCSNGYAEAVNQAQAKAYRASFTCPNTHPICPLFIINDTRQPQCNNGSHRCEMMAIDAIPCGGFILNQHHCPAGYTCQRKGLPDLPGSCVK